MSYQLIQARQMGNLLQQALGILGITGPQQQAMLIGIQMVGEVDGLHHLHLPAGHTEGTAYEDQGDDNLQAQHDVAEEVGTAPVHRGSQSLCGLADSAQYRTDNQGAEQEQSSTDAEAVRWQVPQGEFSGFYQLGEPLVDEVLHPVAHQHGHHHRHTYHQGHLGEEQRKQLHPLGAMGDTQRQLAPAHPEELHLHAQEADEGSQQDERTDQIGQRIDHHNHPQTQPLLYPLHIGLQPERLQPFVHLLLELLRGEALLQHHIDADGIGDLPLTLGATEVTLYIAKTVVDCPVVERTLKGGEVFIDIDDGERQGVHGGGLMPDGAHGIGLAKHHRSHMSANDGFTRLQTLDELSRQGRTESDEPHVVGIHERVEEQIPALGGVAQVPLHHVAVYHPVWDGQLLHAWQSAIALEGTEDVGGDGQILLPVAPSVIGSQRVQVCMELGETDIVGPVVIGLTVNKGKLDPRQGRMSKGQRHDADGNAQHRDKGLKLVLQ